MRERLTERIWVTPKTAKKLKIKKLERNCKSIDAYLADILEGEVSKRQHGFKFPKL